VQDCSQDIQPAPLAIRLIGYDGKTKVSNSGHLLLRTWAIMTLETSISSLSFRSSELSQPSEVLSS
jgi:hypothetical protein